MNKRLDFYVKYSIPIDFFIVVILVCGLLFFKPEVSQYPESSLTDLVSNSISTLVSFAGFILASLTIIVTVKSNVDSKRDSEKTPVGLLLMPGNYKRVVTVFRDSIIELVFCLFVLQVTATPLLNPGKTFLEIALVSTVLIMILSVTRTLLVLFTIIYIEIYPKEGN